nr:hypothetical protein [Streptomyces sp. NRRL S-646]
MAGVGEVEHRAHAGGCGCGWCDQDGAGDAARDPAAHPACG